MIRFDVFIRNSICFSCKDRDKVYDMMVDEKNSKMWFFIDNKILSR